MKTWYKWLVKHHIGVTRAMYLAPLVALFIRRREILYFVALLSFAISSTYCIGNIKGWNKE